LESEVKLSGKDRVLAEAFLALVEWRYPDALGQFEKIVQKYPDEKEAWYGLGEAMFHGPGGMPARLQALDPFEKAIELDPAFTLAYYHVVDLYIMDRRFDDGIEKVRGFIAQDPDNPDWYLAWVRAVIGKGEAQEVDAAVEESLSRIDNPEEQRYVLKGAAMTCRGHGDPERSEELLQRALRIDSADADEPLIASIGDTAADMGEFERAERLYMQVLEAEPGYGPAVNGLFHVLDEQRRFDDTIRLARGLATEQPQHAGALGHWMTAAIHAGDEEEAMAAWRAIEARHEEGDLDMEAFSRLWQTRLRTYFKASNHARIVELCDVALKGAPEDRQAALYTWRGWNHLSLGHLDAATADLEAARRLKASESELELAQAWVATMSGDAAAAVRLADRVDELAGGKPWSRTKQIEMRLRTGDMAKAEELIDKNAKLFVQDKEAKIFYGELATAFFGAGLLEQAEEAARRAVGSDPRPKDLHSLVNLAWVVMRRGNNDEARRLLEQGLEISPQNAGLLYTLAVSDLLEGDAEAAERRVGELLAEGPVRAEGYFIRSYALAQQGRFAEAEKDARRAFSMTPGRAGHALLAWILVAGEIDVKQGLDLAEAALTMPEHFHAEMFKLPFTAPAEHSAGLAFLKLGRKEEAVEMLERAATLRPDRQLIRDDLRRARPMVSRKGS
jgi:tetratricopeptide (TPR) repeat protein